MVKYLDSDGLYELIYMLIVQITIQETINQELIKRISKLETHSIQDSLEDPEE